MREERGGAHDHTRVRVSKPVEATRVRDPAEMQDRKGFIGEDVTVSSNVHDGEGSRKPDHLCFLPLRT